MKIALHTKANLGFIDGSFERPSLDSPVYDQWNRCDNMVVSWLLNSINPSLLGVFIYANSAKELWCELPERFGQSNGPLLYKVHKEASELCQGNDSMVVYYTKMKKLWDELADLSEIPDCGCNFGCEAMKKTLKLSQRQT